MSVHVKDEARRLLPRWRDSLIAASTAEVAPLTEVSRQTTSTLDTSEVDARMREWREVPSVGTAADAVATGVILGLPELVSAPAAFLLANSAQVGPSSLALARRALGTSEERAPAAASPTLLRDHRIVIALLRARLARTPRDPLAYVDLARRYSALGQIHRADASFRAALALAGDNRFVLRSASRFFVHARDPERAQDILRHSGRTRTDPWLLAAEISAATVADRASKLIKTGRDLLARRSFSTLHLSELAGALGTVELTEGNRRGARKYFAQAMEAPTDNSLAQAQWASKALDLQDLPAVDSVPRAYEARALSSLRDGEWSTVLSSCFSWLEDEPFSHKSATIGSFAAATGLGDHATAIEFAREGLTANPHDQNLRNNLIYSLANSDQLVEAGREAQLVDIALMEDETKVAWVATSGLLQYKLGHPILGREYYEAAIAAAERLKKPAMAAIAALNWALTARSAVPEQALEIQTLALRLSEAAKTPAVEVLRERLMSAFGK